MKLRAESTLISRPNSTMSRTLPKVTKRRSSNIHLPVKIPKSDVAKMYEKLSGLYETEGFESFPSRGAIMHPSTVCVRCASHASLCVPCADTLAQEAVGFFRKSQAVGAYHLFDNAIKQAGASKVVRFIVFRCWKNTVRRISYNRGQREKMTSKVYFFRVLREPFASWVKFTRECQTERREKRIEQLEDKVKVLEQTVNKFSMEKAAAEKQIKQLLIIKSKNEEAAEAQRQHIASLDDTIKLERSRVIRLSQLLSETTPRFVNLVKASSKSTLNGSVRHINLTHGMNVSAMNLGKVLKPQTSGRPRPSRLAGGQSSATSSAAGSSTPTTLLLAWTNHISKSLIGVNLQVSSGESVLLEEYLPPYQETKSVETLKSGKQLSRVVVRMIYHILSNQPKAPPPGARPPPRGIRPPMSSDASAPSAPTPVVPTGPPSGSPSISLPPLSLEQLQEIKNSITSNHSLVYITMSLMGKYFKSPMFPIDHIIGGVSDTIQAVIAHLMFVWFGFDGHSASAEEKAEMTKALEKQSKLLSEMEALSNSVCTTKALRIPELTLEDTVSEEQGDVANEPSKKDAKDSSKRTQRMSREDVSSPAPPAGAKDSSRGKESARDKERNPRSIMDLYDEERYALIGSALDNYFCHAGTSEELVKSMADFDRAIRDVNDFSAAVYMKQKHAVTGMQHALDVHRQLAVASTANLVHAAGWQHESKCESET